VNLSKYDEEPDDSTPGYDTYGDDPMHLNRKTDLDNRPQSNLNSSIAYQNDNGDFTIQKSRGKKLQLKKSS
jgi:hypothetical protein